MSSLTVVEPLHALRLGDLIGHLADRARERKEEVAWAAGNIHGALVQAGGPLRFTHLVKNFARLPVIEALRYLLDGDYLEAHDAHGYLLEVRGFFRWTDRDGVERKVGAVTLKRGDH